MNKIVYKHDAKLRNYTGFCTYLHFGEIDYRYTSLKILYLVVLGIIVPQIR